MAENHEVIQALHSGGQRYAPGHILSAKEAEEAGIDTEQWVKLGALKATQKDPEKAAEREEAAQAAIAEAAIVTEPDAGDQAEG
jgi:hypothetical protein